MYVYAMYNACMKQMFLYVAHHKHTFVCLSIQLMSGLPPVVEILGVSGCGQDSLVSLVPAAVGLTVPRPITRAMLNQGVQVKGKTL